MKFGMLAPFTLKRGLNISGYATAWMGGTACVHSEIISWALGRAPFCTTELKFASEAIIRKYWVCFWNRKYIRGSFFTINNI